MFDRMRIPASRENLAPPLLVGNLLVVDVPVEDTRKGPTISLMELALPIAG
jgi:hypothetical protein